MNEKIHTVALEGLNNSGKGTQLTRLSESLNARGILTVVVRGHGSRQGDGRHIGDPVSKWWQKKHSEFMAAGTEGPKSLEAEKEMTARIYRELRVTREYFLPKLMKKSGTTYAVLLLDRSIISRLFVHRRFNKDISHIRLLSFTVGKGTKQKHLALPDLLLVLDVPKKVLLNRNKNRREGAQKIKFNETVITNHYNQFATLLKTLPQEVKKRTVILNGAKTADAVHHDILTTLNKSNLI